MTLATLVTTWYRTPKTHGPPITEPILTIFIWSLLCTGCKSLVTDNESKSPVEEAQGQTRGRGTHGSRNQSTEEASICLKAGDSEVGSISSPNEKKWVFSQIGHLFPQWSLSEWWALDNSAEISYFILTLGVCGGSATKKPDSFPGQSSLSPTIKI